MRSTEAIRLNTTFNTVSTAANNNIIGTALSVPEGFLKVQVTVAVATASVFNVTATKSATTRTIGLNSSTALNAGDLYTFEFAVDQDATYNFQPETTTVVWQLIVDAVTGP